MNILQVHNSYREFGGEDVVVEQEYKLLGRAHKVHRSLLHNNDELNGLIPKIKLLFQTHYSHKSKQNIRRELIANKTDLMHVHNFFPLHTPSIFDAAAEVGVPSVLTLHNYRLIYPNGLLFHQGKIDERSVRGNAWRCVTDGVYRDSILQTAVVAHMIEYHRKEGTWNRVPNIFIALSHFARNKFIEGGLPANRIVVKPNFIDDPIRQLSPNRTNDVYFLYAGRISREKGVRNLVECWVKNRFDVELRIAGSGPERAELKALSAETPSVRWLGRVPRSDIMDLMAGARALIFPSRWYEGFPMTLVEALATGCPSIVSDIGSQAEIIENGITGLHFQLSNQNSLAEAVLSLQNDLDLYNELSQNARQVYLNCYTPEQNYKVLMDIYEKAGGSK